MTSTETQPFVGIVHDLDNADYHALSDLGSSGLKALAKSPAHYYGAYLDPNRPKAESTAAQKAGTLAHCAILEPHALDARYVIKPEGHDGRTKEGKAWCAQMAGFEIITADQLLTAKRQSVALRQIPKIAALLSRGRPEVSAFWVDPETGVRCKCRPDWVAPDGEGVVLVDLKTCQDASPEGFAKAVAKYSYHLQAAHYSAGYAAASGQRVKAFVFACVEADYPHAAAAYQLDDVSMQEGIDLRAGLLELFADCQRSNVWPGYSQDIQPLSLPSWALTPQEVEVFYA